MTDVRTDCWWFITYGLTSKKRHIITFFDRVEQQQRTCPVFASTCWLSPQSSCMWKELYQESCPYLKINVSQVSVSVQKLQFPKNDAKLRHKMGVYIYQLTLFWAPAVSKTNTARLIQCLVMTYLVCDMWPLFFLYRSRSSLQLDHMVDQTNNSLFLNLVSQFCIFLSCTARNFSTPIG